MRCLPLCLVCRLKVGEGFRATRRLSSTERSKSLLHYYGGNPFELSAESHSHLETSMESFRARENIALEIRIIGQPSLTCIIMTWLTKGNTHAMLIAL